MERGVRRAFLPWGDPYPKMDIMAAGTRRPSIWFTVFCLVFGVSMGFGTAAIAMSFWSVFAGEEAPRGLFILVWMLASVVFFAWPMHLVARAYAVRHQREVMRERIGDLDYEPSKFPFLTERVAGAKQDLDIKAPDIGEGRLRTFLSRGRTAEQRMADHLSALELKAEMKRAREAKVEGGARSDPLDRG